MLGLLFEEATGRILSIYVDGNIVADHLFAETLDMIFAESSCWRQHFETILASLKKRMFQFLDRKPQQVDKTLVVHPYAIKKHPDFILHALCRSGKLAFDSVTFLTDSLMPSPGADAGGPTREFICSLAHALLDGSIDRQIKISGDIGLPMAQPLHSSHANAQLQNLGKILGFCFADADIITGSIFPEGFIALIQQMGKDPTLSKEKIAAQSFAIKDDSYSWAWDIYLSTSQSIPQEHIKNLTALIALSTDDDTLREESVEKMNKKTICQYIESSLEKSMSSFVHAALLIANGIKIQLTPKLWTKFLSQPVSCISKAIQGSFSKEIIQNRIRMSQNSYVPIHYHYVLSERIQWFKEIFDFLDDDQAKKAIASITGSSSFVADTYIEVGYTNRHEPEIHTCFFRVDLPIGQFKSVIQSSFLSENDNLKIKFQNLLLYSFGIITLT